jgi:hypothetical protein
MVLFVEYNCSDFCVLNLSVSNRRMMRSPNQIHFFLLAVLSIFVYHVFWCSIVRCTHTKNCYVFSFFGSTEAWLRTLHLLGKCSLASAMPQSFSALVVFSDWVLHFFPRLASDHSPPIYPPPQLRLQTWTTMPSFLFFVVLGLELRAFTLSHSTSPIVGGGYKQGLTNYLPRLVSNHNPPDLCLLSS